MDAVIIAATAETLFDLTQDYGQRLAWDPFLRRAVLAGGAQEPAVGVHAVCTDHWGLMMETEYVSFKRPEVCGVRMVRGPWVIRDFVGSWRFVALADGLTEVKFRYHLAVRPAFLAPVVTAVFRRQMRRRLESLKVFAQKKSRIPPAP